MDRRTILWHCPPRYLGRGSQLTLRPPGFAKCQWGTRGQIREPRRKKTSSQARQALEAHVRLQRWLSCSFTPGLLSCAEPTYLMVHPSAVSGDPGCPRNMAGALAGDAGPQSSSRSWAFSRLLQINRVFAGTFLSHRSQAMSGLLNIYLQMWVTVTVNAVSLSRGMRHLCLNMYLCYFQAARTSCWCDCWLWHCML